LARYTPMCGRFGGLTGIPTTMLFIAVGAAGLAAGEAAGEAGCAAGAEVGAVGGEVAAGEGVDAGAQAARVTASRAKGANQNGGRSVCLTTFSGRDGRIAVTLPGCPRQSRCCREGRTG
jgi:hypothetical protein